MFGQTRQSHVVVQADTPQSVVGEVDAGSVALAEHALGLFDGVE
jgi:hypothetical protein